MAEIRSADDIGMKGLRILANVPDKERFDIVAEGLPILMKSAEDLLLASEVLDDHQRAASILIGQATEELAKVLMLVDLVRCPAKLRASRVSFMVKWFYSHLARQLYVESQSWKPMHVDQLQEYMDDQRKSHYLDGPVGEYIFPNSAVFLRESQLYADLMLYEDGTRTWNEPSNEAKPFARNRPHVWTICNALRDFGALSRKGLDIVSESWERIDFKGDQDWSAARGLTQTMLEGLQQAKLISEAATEEQLGPLYNHWQIPMYHIDFHQIDVPLDQLMAQRDANLYNEIGDWY
jgi:hypothetical protein